MLDIIFYDTNMYRFDNILKEMFNLIHNVAYLFSHVLKAEQESNYCRLRGWIVQAIFRLY